MSRCSDGEGKEKEREDVFVCYEGGPKEVDIVYLDGVYVVVIIIILSYNQRKNSTSVREQRKQKSSSKT